MNEMQWRHNMGRLRKLDIPIVSLVGKPAIRRQFLVVKSAGGDNEMAKNELENEESFVKELREALDGETPNISRALEIVKSMEDAVEELEKLSEEDVEVEKCGSCGAEVAPSKPKPVNGYINLSLSVSEESVKFWQLMDAMATVSRNIVETEGDIIEKSQLITQAAEDFTAEYVEHMTELLDGEAVQKSEGAEDMEIEVDVHKAGRAFSTRNKAEIVSAISVIADLVGFDVAERIAEVIEGDPEDAGEGEANVQKGDDEADGKEPEAEGSESAEEEDLTDEEIEKISEAVEGVAEAVSKMATKEDVDKLVRNAADGGE